MSPFDVVLRRALAAGVLPADAVLLQPETRPWPVVLLTALGAWLAAIPLLIVVGLLLGDWISRGPGPYGIGALLLVGAVTVLRARELSPFFEQLAIPALLVAGGSLGFGLFRDLPDRGAATVLAALALTIALAIARPWLRGLLGAAAAGLLASALAPDGASISHDAIVGTWFGLHAVLALWLGALWLQRSALDDGAHAPLAAAIESCATGWLLTTLAGLAVLSGMTFLLGGVFGGGLVAEVAREITAHPVRHELPLTTQALSALLALLACGIVVRQWPGLRQLVLLPIASVLVALAAYLPALGAVFLALSLTLTTRRYRQAAAAGLAAAWIVGGFYYQLHWPLVTKALVLAACGAVLGLIAWRARARDDRDSGAGNVRATHGPARLAGLSTLATLAVVNTGIWQNESLIAHGQPVFVELAPVDPRSLMQGDYMRLNFRLPGDVLRDSEAPLRWQRPRVVGQRDPRGVATFLRAYQEGAPLASDEFVVELTAKNGRWMLVTDAWFFKEGDAKRWEAAKFGEFRVAASGKALLVGLSDAHLHAIQP